MLALLRSLIGIYQIMVILDHKQIEELIDLDVAGAAIEAAYIAASNGEVTLPPVGHITFPDVAGDCHIKYGHVKGDPSFVIKIATGFPHNAQSGLPTGNGMSLVMSAQTGVVQAVLHDEMVMTDIRTGLGGAIATKCLARSDSKRVLIVGTGPQAMRQIESHIALIGDRLSFEVWGRSAAKAQSVVCALQPKCKSTVADDLAAATRKADIVVTATGSTAPLIKDAWVGEGTHITAVGADAPGKQELETRLISRADVLVADSIDQCLDHGEMSHAFGQELISRQNVVEIGTTLSGATLGRTNATQLTIADLTGIAAQDIAIAHVVLKANRND
jgi:ornithine cyclodeaminase/alanine dehydrogenase-like protein (mu-crystallin family)